MFGPDGEPQRQTIRVAVRAKILSLTLDRPELGNPINAQLIDELTDALAQAEADPAIRIVTIEGRDGVFSTGMDFRGAVRGVASAGDVERSVSRYFALLKRFTRSGKVLVAKVDGKVNAGGVGLVAACDFVLASERASFSLSEALFGLLPASVVPFLLRRIGFQKAYTMTLTAQTLDAHAALGAGLVDELTPNLDDGVRRLLVRIDRVRERTITAAKRYFERMWFLTEASEREAIRQSTELLEDPEVYEDIRAFVEEQVFPWQRS